MLLSLVANAIAISLERSVRVGVGAMAVDFIVVVESNFWNNFFFVAVFFVI